jgi:hypothetical protein
MRTHAIHVISGREHALAIRGELFAFTDVLDVFVTGQPDVLVVVCSGRPRPAEWIASLRAAGYEVPVRRNVQRLTHNVAPLASRRRRSIGTRSATAVGPVRAA